MNELIGGALVMLGGGMIAACAWSFGHFVRLHHHAAEFGAGLAAAMADTASAPIPPDQQALLDRLA